MQKVKIPIAFIGAGNMTIAHMKAFSDIEEVEVAGIYTRTREKAVGLQSVYSDLKIFDSVESLYNGTHAALVVVSVAELSVAAVLTKCMNFPWACLCEKPVGIDYQQALFLHDLVQKKSSRVFVALNRRHYHSTKTALADLNTSNEKRIIQVSDQEDILIQRKIGTTEELVKHWMYANSIHLVDYFSSLGRGKIINVENLVKFDPEHPSLVVSRIDFDSGDIGIYQAVWNAPSPWLVSVTTDSKRWEMRPLEQAYWQEYGTRKLNPVEPHPWDTDFKPGLRLQAQEAIKAIKGLPHQLPDLAESLQTMKLISSIYGL